MMSGMTTDVVVRPVEPADHEAWQRLFHAYRTFYEYDEGRTSSTASGVIHDEAHETNALVAELDGEVVGFAHHREFAARRRASAGLSRRPVREARRTRPGDRPGTDHAPRRARRERRGFDKVRWITDEEDNHTAHAYTTRWPSAPPRRRLDLRV